MEGSARFWVVLKEMNANFLFFDSSVADITNIQNCLEAIQFLQMQKWMPFHLGAFCVALRCREILARLVEADTTMENGSVRPIFEEMLIDAYLWSNKSAGTD